MLVEAQDLTRYYGSFLAVDHVSFSIDRGEIIGLLGPNGAGKTTTIRMLTGFLPAHGGTASIAGCDIRGNPTELRRHVGYMPENNPLYPQMRAVEYLSFRAHLKGVPRKRRNSRIDECVELCGLADVAHQIIGTLSKGFRQRVGLADALLGEPDVLVLDEPTIGLDPNQVRLVRELVRSLSAQHTVLISTHILAEAEAICKRIFIIDKGRIVADDTPHGLIDKTLRGEVVVEMRGDPEEMKAVLGRIDGVDHVHLAVRGRWSRLSLATAPDVDIREDVFRTAVDRGWPLRELARTRGSLEDVFHRITLGAEERPQEEGTDGE